MRWFSGLLCAWAALAQQQPQSEIQKALDEFRLQTRNLGLGPDGARKGRRNSAARSAWHGRLFENFRNDFLDAVPHEIRQRGGNKSLLRRNQFGFNVVRPGRHPEALSRRPRYLLLPLLRRRAGAHFPLLPAHHRHRPRTHRGLLRHRRFRRRACCRSTTPRTTRPNPAYDPSQPVSPDNLQYFRDTFPANRDSRARLDPVAQKALAFYPRPTPPSGRSSAITTSSSRPKPTPPTE